MSDQGVATPPEVIREIDQKFTEAAVAASVAPVLINRFQIMPRQDGVFVLAFGGVGAAQGPIGDPFVRVSIHSASAFNRNTIADLAISLPFACGLSDEEITEAYARNPHIPRR
jgi:hypothetical protein